MSRPPDAVSFNKGFRESPVKKHSRSSSSSINPVVQRFFIEEPFKSSRLLRQPIILQSSIVQTVADSALPRCRTLSESDVMLLLLRPRTLLEDIKTNAGVIEALGEGRIYATISDENMYVDLFTSPLMLRGVLGCFDRKIRKIIQL